MATRRDGREWALQILFGLDLNRREDLDAVFEYFFDVIAPNAGKMRVFSEDIVRGVVGHRDELDKMIEKYAEHWSVRRMGVVERNVMRMAVYELMYSSDIPAPVILNEAIDIAKYFSNAESGRFINGVLDRARRELRSDS
jgi:N utilization substance protein B